MTKLACSQCNIRQICLVLLAIINIFPVYVVYAYPYDALNDDSLITLTYAKNLAHGHGFVFNHAPAALGTTTPLFTLLVAAIALLVPYAELAWIAVLLSVVCWVGIELVILWFRHPLGLTLWQATILCIVIVATGWIGNLGMEAYPFAFLLLASIALFLDNRYFAAGLSVGLLFLTRHEGVLIFGLFLSDCLIKSFVQAQYSALRLRQQLFKLCLGFACTVLPWFCYAYGTFGTLVPNTLAAKMAQGRLTFGRPFLQRLLQEWAPNWGQQLAWARFPLLNLWWVLVIIGLITVVVQKRKWFFFLVWILAYIGGYSVLGVAAYSWYQLPIVFVANLLLGLGLITCIEFFVKQQNFRWGRFTAAVTLTAFVVFQLAQPRIAAVLNKQGDTRSDSYRQLAAWIRQHTPPTASIAYIEIGYLGYYTDNRIIDLGGLVLPDVATHLAKGDMTWAFWHYLPDYYIDNADFDFWGLKQITSDPRFRRDYQIVADLPGPGNARLVIYQRTPAQTSRHERPSYPNFCCQL